MPQWCQQKGWQSTDAGGRAWTLRTRSVPATYCFIMGFLQRLCFLSTQCGAQKRTRTSTIHTDHQHLKLARLPIPPSGPSEHGSDVRASGGDTCHMCLIWAVLACLAMPCGKTAGIRFLPPWQSQRQVKQTLVDGLEPLYFAEASVDMQISETSCLANW